MEIRFPKAGEILSVVLLPAQVPTQPHIQFISRLLCRGRKWLWRDRLLVSIQSRVQEYMEPYIHAPISLHVMMHI